MCDTVDVPTYAKEAHSDAFGDFFKKILQDRPSVTNEYAALVSVSLDGFDKDDLKQNLSVSKVSTILTNPNTFLRIDAAAQALLKQVSESPEACSPEIVELLEALEVIEKVHDA